MEVEAFLLCDCATDQQGKLNILGAFDRLYTTKNSRGTPRLCGSRAFAILKIRGRRPHDENQFH